VAATLLPDIFETTTQPVGVLPNNGRTLTDDAADTFMAILTNGKIPGMRSAQRRFAQ